MNTINLTYNGPQEDMISVLGYNTDKSVNVKFSLLNFKNLLTDNIFVINKLIDNADNIKDIKFTDNGKIRIILNDNAVEQKLIEEKILVDDTVIEEDDIYSDEEPNYLRLDNLYNIINRNNFNLNHDESDSESASSDDELISDDKNITNLTAQFSKLNTDIF